MRCSATAGVTTPTVAPGPRAGARNGRHSLVGSKGASGSNDW